MARVRVPHVPLQRLTYSVPEIAAVLGVGLQTATEMVRDGAFGDPSTFPTTPGGGKLLVPADGVHAFAKPRTPAPDPAVSVPGDRPLP